MSVELLGSGEIEEQKEMDEVKAKEERERISDLSTSLSSLKGDRELTKFFFTEEETAGEKKATALQKGLEKIDDKQKPITERYESIRDHLVEKYGLSNEYAALITSYYLVSNGVSADEVAEKLYNDLEGVAGEWGLYAEGGDRDATRRMLKEKLTLSLTLLTYRMTGEIPSGKGAELAEAEVENAPLYIRTKHGEEGERFFNAVVHLPLHYFRVGENVGEVDLEEIVRETGISSIRYSNGKVIITYSSGKRDEMEEKEFLSLVSDIYQIGGMDRERAEGKAKYALELVKKGSFTGDVENVRKLAKELWFDGMERYILSYWVVKGSRAEASEKEVEKGRYAVFILVYGRPPKGRGERNRAARGGGEGLWFERNILLLKGINRQTRSCYI